MLEEAGRNPRAIFVPLNKMIRVHGREIKLTGGIKSLDPPCLEEAMSHGKHPFSCSNCARQERDLKNTLQHRRSGSLKDTDNQIGLSGFNKRYARKGELEDALEKAEYRQRSAQKQLQEMAKVKLAPSEIEGCLLDSCIAGDDQKLVIDLVRLFQSGTANKNPVQVLVLRNLVSKLRKNNNHHYTALIKERTGPNKLCPFSGSFWISSGNNCITP